MSDLVENNMEHAEEYDEIYRWRDLTGRRNSCFGYVSYEII